jgi:DNA polymerase (family 10)
VAVRTLGVEHGLTMAIDRHAHRVDQLRYMRYGIDQARRWWLEKRHGVNIMPRAEFRRWLWRR